MYRPKMYVGDFKNPTNVYCVVDDILQPQNSIVAAVDLCFKIFFVTHCNYPEESQHLWLTLQLGFYEISTKYDKIHAPTTKLLADLALMPKANRAARASR